MEIKTFALQWLKSHNQLVDKNSSTYQQSLCVMDLFDSLEEQQNSKSSLKNIITIFAKIVGCYYNADDEDW